MRRPVAAAACLVLSGVAAACPPPPGPPKTIDAQATARWNDSTNLCELTLEEMRPLAERFGASGRWTIAARHWEATARTTASIKGRCEAGRVVFPEISPALCGLPVPVAGERLVAAIEDDLTLSWWSAVDAPVAIALRTRVARAGDGTAVVDSRASVPVGPFDQRLALKGIAFHVTSPNASTGNTLRVVPSGLEIDNSPIDWDVTGVVTGAEVADINADRSPELYIYVRGPDPERRGSVVAFSANKRKSLGFIALPELEQHRGASTGYRGHDDFAVVKGAFVRRFPLFGKGGDPAAPTGRTRELRYSLRPGEASWVLKLERMTEY
jgi:hypothetical protein